MLLAIIVVISLPGCSTNRLAETAKEESIAKKFTTSASNLAKNIIPLSMPTPVPEDCYATIVSFGDTLCHKPLYNAAYDNETGIYDFSYMFEYVEKYFKNSTINIGNCESPMAGSDRGYSGYPCFNAPEHLAIDLQELGVDIMTTANNHTLDNIPMAQMEFPFQKEKNFASILLMKHSLKGKLRVPKMKEPS